MVVIYFILLQHLASFDLSLNSEKLEIDDGKYKFKTFGILQRILIRKNHEHKTMVRSN